MLSKVTLELVLKQNQFDHFVFAVHVTIEW